MPRIVGVDIPNEKAIWGALTYIPGVGLPGPANSAKTNLAG